MAKEGSVAPKERVNIVYRPATGDAKEEVELPLKLLIVGDNFNEVLKAQNLNLDLTVPNKLSGEPDEEMSVSLKFESIKDFDPEAIARNSTELSKLLELREALKALKGPMSNRPEFRKKIQELIKDDAAREQILNELKVEEE
jgi:type VI secretion system protein ImpB